jgi:hypothetical protein
MTSIITSPNIISVIKSKRMEKAGLVTRIREMRNAYISGPKI